MGIVIPLWSESNCNAAKYWSHHTFLLPLELWPQNPEQLFGFWIDWMKREKQVDWGAVQGVDCGRHCLVSHQSLLAENVVNVGYYSLTDDLPHSRNCFYLVGSTYPSRWMAITTQFGGTVLLLHACSVLILPFILNILPFIGYFLKSAPQFMHI